MENRLRFGASRLHLAYTDGFVSAIRRKAYNVDYHDSSSFPFDPNDKEDDVALVVYLSNSGKKLYIVGPILPWWRKTVNLKEPTRYRPDTVGGGLVRDVVEMHHHGVVVSQAVGLIIGEREMVREGDGHFPASGRWFLSLPIA